MRVRYGAGSDSRGGIRGTAGTSSTRTNAPERVCAVQPVTALQNEYSLWTCQNPAASFRFFRSSIASTLHAPPPANTR